MTQLPMFAPGSANREESVQARVLARTLRGDLLAYPPHLFR